MTDQRRRRTPGASPTTTLTADVITGPGGAMTRQGGTVSGTLTVTTTALPGGRAAQVTVRLDGETDEHALAGSPFPIPPEGIEALHAVVLTALGAEARHRPAGELL